MNLVLRALNTQLLSILLVLSYHGGKRGRTSKCTWCSAHDETAAVLIMSTKITATAQYSEPLGALPRQPNIAFELAHTHTVAAFSK